MVSGAPDRGGLGRKLQRLEAHRVGLGAATASVSRSGQAIHRSPRLGFAGFSALAGLHGLRGGRVDAVLAMSPPLTLGLTGWVMHLVRRGPLVFNIQDVFPDAAVETGAITNERLIGLARWLERLSYRRSAAVTVLSDDLRQNLVEKLGPLDGARVEVIPNFVDTDAIRPMTRWTAYRQELGIGDERS
ncbi:MAG: glycosyltransferase [Ilumatobacteraceae bacterium]